MLSVGDWITAPRKSTTLGCRRPCITRISSLNSCTVDPVRLLSCICLSATSVPFQSAVNTCPNEPLPMRQPNLSSCGGITQRPAAWRSARCAALCNPGSSRSPSDVTVEAPPPPNGANFAAVFPTPPGFRFVGVGAYSTVDSNAASSRNVTLREPSRSPLAPPPKPNRSAMFNDAPPFFLARLDVLRSAGAGRGFSAPPSLPPPFAESHSAGTLSPRLALAGLIAGLSPLSLAVANPSSSCSSGEKLENSDPEELSAIASLRASASCASSIPRFASAIARADSSAS